MTFYKFAYFKEGVSDSKHMSRGHTVLQLSMKQGLYHGETKARFIHWKVPTFS
jgi:hypothetical protein